MNELGPLIQVDDIVAGYLPGVDILNGCSLDLHPGEVIGIIGPNGAGKSTLLKAVFGLVDIRSGSVSMANEDITGLRPHELVSRGIGFVPQTDNVFPRLTIKENLEMGAFQEPSQFEPRFEAVAELFPLLAERRDQRADGLSGGQRQMVAIGRALMMDPQVVLLDEPSAGLSPAYQDQVFEQVTRIAQHGVSLIMVEQNARRCLEICDRGYVLDQGTNAYTGTGRELLDDSKVVSLYLGTLMGS
ncbi:ABC transporter ATP-binding protein [Candidatus Poriferisocius sp.]|uniref:ABC transporter ATP-binding protein n=1 Tax=Candidatus Poriferisocius sp. TaxID=3101276 RepID=UPI003B0218FE